MIHDPISTRGRVRGRPLTLLVGALLVAGLVSGVTLTAAGASDLAFQDSNEGDEPADEPAPDDPADTEPSEETEPEPEPSDVSPVVWLGALVVLLLRRRRQNYRHRKYSRIR